MKTLSIPIVCTLSIFITWVYTPINHFTEIQADQTSDHIYAKIDSLIITGNYFSAQDFYISHFDDLTEFHQLKSGTILDYYFNRADSSIFRMNLLFERFESELADSVKYQFLSFGQVNYSRQYEYRKAKETIEEILTGYSHYLSDREIEDLENTLIIWTALQDQPKQEVVFKNPVDMRIIRDKAGLQNLQVSNGVTSHNFVFDTGANISVITESMAERFGLEILEGTFQVRSITGRKVPSQIAVAPKLDLDNITIKNAVFMVFSDENLAFPQIEYQINGILGFPVIEALKEIQITRDDRFIVSGQQTTTNLQNLALDFLTPILFLRDERGEGTYIYDTGAVSSTLYDNYYNRYKEEFTDYPEVDHSFGGAGGHITRKGIYITFKPEYFHSIVTLDSTIVLKESLHEDNIYLGSIGQDFISRFDRVTLNFNRMFIRFDPGD